VVVLAGGHDDDRDLVDIGLVWGDRLDRPVHVVRAAHLEPAAVPDGRPGEPRTDPDAHLAALLDPVHPVRRLDGEVVRSPLGARDAVAARLPALQPAIVVVGSHRRHGLARLVAGDHGADFVHDAPAPALAVPLGLRS
jgi:nucleotide-binding universal stress UspA family protein